ncbi:hypothetical protein [Isoptericola dokdonensis]|uniref:Uncharacterized protein n=1 Tax=Isoptericola dokdonensis DS-3 TaxID=1300344 RepID=A0A161I7C1_9MICO|nr:hypothetical protein [Isoptericola dokdonensis]ANC31458.1 hypothetical protein I598_1910 [Isoptericola dokdonensis DS-3]
MNTTDRSTDMCLTCGHACPARLEPRRTSAVNVLGRVIAVAILLAILTTAVGIGVAGVRWIAG